ncbi:MAG: hypothetical protein A3H01_01560 [Candidatus Wildermuthbacteria bacterium RIFCSPLOWO2_12_FULL_40_9]|uniref:Ribonuclease J n=2 Tax=Candidatus Wildermuthiibacteriota TaxID=1817923 RepID=A0A1G2RCE1_9BACT|nr:MAG: hypothetical protein A3F15_03040 [Candidatus Wildermuthbacteria bacterium RIFCSPHIGHO2_12_FULL_40_12]OHA76783.1 MAG: hypothetical protein A3H01_01560 [Candidatus Wildermuthbacteria bacterium RIFCSPLOWO2_12_FULL_40_9]
MTTKSNIKRQELKIIPLGGQEEVGRNMTVFEYDDDIVILDMGLQFPEEDMPGIDYIIPDIHYLENKKKNIRGVIFSHGHLDHIGAAAHLLPRLGWPPVYGGKMTLLLLKKRLEEYKLERYLKTHEIKSFKDEIKLGNHFKVGFFKVAHSVMDAIGIILQTPKGNIIHPGDWRYNLNPVKDQPTDFSYLSRWNTKEQPSVLMMEALGSTKSGHQLSESEVNKNIRKIIEAAPGRIIIATFASMIERVAQIVTIAEELGKKVAMDGYSMKTNIEIAKKIGYVKFSQNVIIDVKDIRNYPPNKIVLIVTGAQGEDRAALMRISNGEHRHIKVEKSDTIVFSSSVIPGNERTIQRLKDTLYRQAANVIHKEIMDVHSGGHAFIEDIKLLIRQVKPKYLLPVYANYYMLYEACKVAESIGFPKKNMFILDNGNVGVLDDYGFDIKKEKIPIQYVFVDGFGVGDVGEVVIRDRQVLSKHGMFVIVVVIDKKSGKVKNSPDIISRGFVYLKESKELLAQTRRKVIEIIDKATGSEGATNWVYVKDEIKNKIGEFLYRKTQRKPMVLPVLIEV